MMLSVTQNIPQTLHFWLQVCPVQSRVSIEGVLLE